MKNSDTITIPFSITTSKERIRRDNHLVIMIWIDPLSSSLCNAIGRNDPSVTSADFRYNDLIRDNIIALSNALKNNIYVTHLNMTGNDIDIDMTYTLLKAIGKNQRLDSIDLGMTGMDDMCGDIIVSVLNQRERPLKIISKFGTKFSREMKARFEDIFNRKNTSFSGGEDLEDKLNFEKLLKRWNEKRILDKDFIDSLLSLSNEKSVEFMIQIHQYEYDFSILSQIETGSGNHFTACSTQNTHKLERIQAGGSGAIIYLAEVDGWGCVMKELNTETNSTASVKKFEHEINILMMLPKHPNIIRYLAHRYKGPIISVYVTRYQFSFDVYLEDLKKKIIAKKDFPLEIFMISKFAKQIILGIKFLHKNGIFHRDLKTGNIFAISDQREEIQTLVIADFDTAVTCFKETDKIIDEVVGTVAYMAPEVLDRKSYGFSADIWSYGMILFEILTLTPPFEGIDEMEIAEFLRYGDLPEYPESIMEHNEFVQISKQCTSMNPLNRPTTKEIKRRIKNFEQDNYFNY